jgi:hypothetical protein
MECIYNLCVYDCNPENSIAKIGYKLLSNFLNINYYVKISLIFDIIAKYYGNFIMIAKITVSFIAHGNPILVR